MKPALTAPLWLQNTVSGLRSWRTERLAIMRIEGVIFMRLTAEEKLMYEVMKAIYENGIPIDFKGSMVLKACLLGSGYF